MIIGIDLGSSNTCAAVWDGRLRMVEITPGGAVSMPSVVTIADGKVLVGQDAVEAGTLHPDYDFRNFKRRMAEKWHPDEDTGFQTCEGMDGMVPNGMLHYRGPDGFTYSPTELSTQVIAEIVHAANEFLAPHDTVTGAVIGVPATFEPDQIEAVKEAARAAGLETVYTIEEPVAAAIANNVDAKKSRCSIVVDFGGGTLDITILRSGGGLIRVLAKNGIGDLGGADWDKRIADYVMNLFRTEYRSAEGGESNEVTLRDNMVKKIMVQAEAVKKRLTDTEQTEFRENAGTSPGGTTRHMVYNIDRRILGELTRDLQERIIAACKATIEDAKRKDPKFTMADIQDVLLVGGMTRVPAVRQLVSEFFGKQPRKDESPEFVVAQGCAIKAAIIEGRRPDVSVADITSMDVALERANNVPAIILPRGSNFPTKKVVKVRNADDDQTEISLRLIYATRPKAADCHLLDAREVPIDPVPAETREIEVTIEIDAEGHPSITHVAA